MAKQVTTQRHHFCFVLKCNPIDQLPRRQTRTHPVRRPLRYKQRLGRTREHKRGSGIGNRNQHSFEILRSKTNRVTLCVHQRNWTVKRRKYLKMCPMEASRRPRDRAPRRVQDDQNSLSFRPFVAKLKFTLAPQLALARALARALEQAVCVTSFQRSCCVSYAIPLFLL